MLARLIASVKAPGAFGENETGRSRDAPAMRLKGAAGQAVQNMNLMLGFPETTGLEQVALFP